VYYTRSGVVCQGVFGIFLEDELLKEGSKAAENTDAHKHYHHKEGECDV